VRAIKLVRACSEVQLDLWVHSRHSCQKSCRHFNTKAVFQNLDASFTKAHKSILTYRNLNLISCSEGRQESRIEHGEYTWVCLL